MTGKRKMRKKIGNKMKALIEKENVGSCSSNDSDTDVDILFDENTSNNSVVKINCNKTDLPFDSSPENLESKANITASTENINPNIKNDLQ